LTGPLTSSWVARKAVAEPAAGSGAELHQLLLQRGAAPVEHDRGAEHADPGTGCDGRPGRGLPLPGDLAEQRLRGQVGALGDAVSAVVAVPRDRVLREERRPAVAGGDRLGEPPGGADPAALELAGPLLRVRVAEGRCPGEVDHDVGLLDGGPVLPGVVRVPLHLARSRRAAHQPDDLVTLGHEVLAQPGAEEA
jgi:hypothetical protein